jgi:1,4-alpha-glucan branching enzyme
MCAVEIGAWLEDGVCRLRVWAPHSTQVDVLIQSGEFWRHDYQARRVALEPGAEEGYWGAVVDGSMTGHLYRQEITHQGRTRQKLDGTARGVLHSGLTHYDPDNENASVVVGDEPVSWSPYQTPRFENFILYQVHVRTFAGRNDELSKRIAAFRDVETKFE